MKKALSMLTVTVILAMAGSSWAGLSNYSWKYFNNKVGAWTESLYFVEQGPCTPNDSDSSSCTEYDIGTRAKYNIDGVKFFVRTSEKLAEITWLMSSNGSSGPCPDFNAGPDGRDMHDGTYQYYCADEDHYDNSLIRYEVGHVTYKWQSGTQRERSYTLPNVYP